MCTRRHALESSNRQPQTRNFPNIPQEQDRHTHSCLLCVCVLSHFGPDSLLPCGLLPARLPWQWDFPDKDTGANTAQQTFFSMYFFLIRNKLTLSLCYQGNLTKCLHISKLCFVMFRLQLNLKKTKELFFIDLNFSVP